MRRAICPIVVPVSSLESLRIGPAPALDEIGGGAIVPQFVTDEEGETIRRRAESLGLTVSRYLADVIRREVAVAWPKGFFEEVVGGWQGDPLERPPQEVAEVRESL